MLLAPKLGKIRIAGIAAFMLALLTFLVPNDSASAQSNKRAASSAKKADAGASRLDGTNLKQVENLILKGKKSEAEIYVQSRVRQIIGSLISSPYSVFVKLTLDNRKLTPTREGILANRRLATIDAERVYINTIEQMSPLTFLSNARKIEIKLQLDQTVKDATVKSLTENISENLGLKEKRGDKLTVEKLDLQADDTDLQRRLKETIAKLEELQRSMLDKESELSKMQQDLRIAIQNLELERERARGLDNKVSLLEEKNRALIAENEGLKAKLEAALKRIKDLEDIINNKKIEMTPWERFRKLISGMELAIALLAIALVAAFVFLVTLLVENKRQKSKIGAMDRVVSNLSSAIEKIGTNIVDAAKLQMETHDDAAQAENGEDDENVELLQKEALASWEQLRNRLPLVLHVLRDWLSDPKEKAQFVAFSEGIGSKESEVIWGYFPQEEIDGLSTLLQSNVSRSKAFSAVLKLSRIAAKERAMRPGYFDGLPLRPLLSVTDRKLALILTDMDKETAGKILVLTSASRAQRILTLIKSEEKQEIVSGMQKATQMQKEDAEAVLVDLETALAEEETGTQFELTSHFALLMESKNKGDAKLVDSVLAEDDNLRKKVRDRVVTFDAFFEQENDFMSEELMRLSPEDAALLASSLEEDQRQRILGFFSGKLLFRLQADLKKFSGSALASRKAAMDGQKVQQRMIERMRKLALDGLIDIYRNDDTDSEGVNDNQNAA